MPRERYIVGMIADVGCPFALAVSDEVEHAASRSRFMAVAGAAVLV